MVVEKLKLAKFENFIENVHFIENFIDSFFKNLQFFKINWKILIKIQNKTNKNFKYFLTSNLISGRDLGCSQSFANFSRMMGVVPRLHSP